MISKKVNNLNQIFAADISSRCVNVYLYLYQRANKESSCFPSIATICKDLKISRSTVKRALADLVKQGFLIRNERYRENGGRSSNLYILK